MKIFNYNDPVKGLAFTMAFDGGHAITAASVTFEGREYNFTPGPFTCWSEVLETANIVKDLAFALRHTFSSESVEELCATEWEVADEEVTVDESVEDQAANMPPLVSAFVLCADVLTVLGSENARVFGFACSTIDVEAAEPCVEIQLIGSSGFNAWVAALPEGDYPL